MIFPTLEITFQVKFAVTQTIVIVSRMAVDVTDPDVIVAEDPPKKICWFVVYETFHPVALFMPVTEMMSPTALVVGNVKAICPALLAIYPLFTAIACDAPVITVHVIAPPTAFIVIEPDALVIETPVPAVKDAAVGSLAVVPISNCPAPCRTDVIELAVPPTRVA